ncbi:MAG TPA: FAD-linked oxidase C-terminal domain-containing protein [Alphaproteobacteria bacterium]|nr:FAD-linked oxidase C-terminal domain-containing protein [Alphaproteobacteria bacterium]
MSVQPKTAAAPRLPTAAAHELKALLGERFTTAMAVRQLHGKDESSFRPAPPDAVAYAHSTEEVSEIVKLCARHKVPVIPFGTGTSLEGHVLAIKGGLCIDLSQMNKVLRVSAEDLDCTVQAGVTRKQLNQHIRDTGLFFPIDPGADASLGGMAATRASGTNAVRYGTMRENVLALTVVLPDGRIVRTARRARKSAAGYDLTRLFVGSEGTLCVITEVTLRLYGIPEAILAAVCPFPSLDAAVRTVIQTIQMGIPIARIELIDPHAMRAINRYSKLDYPESFTLFFEFHGSESGVKEQVETVQAIAGERGANDFRWAARPEDRSKLWQARHDLYFASLNLRPGCRGLSTDVCVPISRLADCILETYEDISKASMPITLVGHVGDGNFHLLFLIDPESEAERHEAETLNERMVMRALAMDGTCTGEHGIGMGKMDFLVAEHGEAVSVMRQLKRAIDPDDLMNPGKVLRM